ncbi:MAG: L,D-transpeptidase [Bdellovibrionales bacterium]
MGSIRNTLMAIVLFGSGSLMAQSGTEEQERLSKISKANDLTEVADLMTPAEFSAAFAHPEYDPIGIDLIHPIVRVSPEGQFTVRIQVSIRNQSIRVTYPGGTFDDLVSTGRPGYSTPTGCFRPDYTGKMHYSRKYNNAPMPDFQFINGGVALHGTYEEGRLGRKASHGCIRLRRTTAKWLRSIVEGYGKAKTLVCVY